MRDGKSDHGALPEGPPIFARRSRAIAQSIDHVVHPARGAHHDDAGIDVERRYALIGKIDKRHAELGREVTNIALAQAGSKDAFSATSDGAELADLVTARDAARGRGADLQDEVARLRRMNADARRHARPEPRGFVA